MTAAALLLALLTVTATEAEPAAEPVTSTATTVEAAPAAGSKPVESAPAPSAWLRSWIAGGEGFSPSSASSFFVRPAATPQPAVSRQLRLRLAGVTTPAPSWQAPVDDDELLVGKSAIGAEGPFFLPPRSTTRLSLWSRDGVRGSSLDLSAEPSCPATVGDSLVSGEQTKAAAQADERAWRDD